MLATWLTGVLVWVATCAAVSGAVMLCAGTTGPNGLPVGEAAECLGILAVLGAVIWGCFCWGD